jgi:hypothetical protein
MSVAGCSRDPSCREQVRASNLSAELKGGGGEAAVSTLRKASKGVKVLNVTNLGSLDASKGYLSSSQTSTFSKTFRYAGGSWCCAPNDDKKAGGPNSAHFRLMSA